MKAPSRSQIIAATLLGAVLAGYFVLRDRPSADSRKASSPGFASAPPASMAGQPDEEDYSRRSEAHLPPPGDTRPLPDQTLIALAEKSPLPALEPVGQKVARARSEGYLDTELVNGAVAQELAAVVEKSINGGEDSSLLRGFERSLKARARVGFDSSAIVSLLAFLRVAPEGLSPSVYHSIANDIIRLLVSDATLSAETVSSLAGIVDDASCDPLVRDYVVQHLEDVYRLPAFQRTVEDHLVRWMASGGESVPGVAMLIVERALCEGRFSGDAGTIEASVAQQLAQDNVECQVAALSLGVSQRYACVAGPARLIAADLDASPALRAAAIHALGTLGDPQSDPALLDAQLRRPGGAFLQSAVAAANTRLSSSH
jgi:hypothetical protein